MTDQDIYTQGKSYVNSAPVTLTRDVQIPPTPPDRYGRSPKKATGTHSWHLSGQLKVATLLIHSYLEQVLRAVSVLSPVLVGQGHEGI